MAVEQATRTEPRPAKPPGLKRLGYGIFGTSMLAWCLLTAIPFLGLGAERATRWAAGVFAFAQVTWWLCLPLLGRDALSATRNWMRRVRGQRSERQDQRLPE